MKFHPLSTLLRAALCATVLVSSASWGVTTTPAGSFVLSKGDNSSIDFVFKVDSDPGDKSHIFWSQQFWFEKGPGGYLGIQRGGEVKQIIFSIWNAPASVALMDGAIAEPFGGEGDGQHVLGAFDWQLGHSYRFRLENAGGTGPWWQVSITDLDTNQTWPFGKIQGLPEWGNLTQNVSTFTEVYGGGESCERIPYVRAEFGSPSSDNGVGTTTELSAGTYGSFPNPCTIAEVPGAKDGVNVGTRSDVVGSSLVEQIGLSNGPQNWDDYGQKGKIGTIFKYENPSSNRTEYNKLIALGSDGRYGYFPTDENNNFSWEYLGTNEPFYNGPPVHVWGENDRMGTIGDIYAETLSAGTTLYFRLVSVGPDKRYWYLPSTPTDNAYWQYLGTNMGKVAAPSAAPAAASSVETTK
jgi:hypothetical protein